MQPPLSRHKFLATARASFARGLSAVTPDLFSQRGVLLMLFRAICPSEDKGSAKLRKAFAQILELPPLLTTLAARPKACPG